jgi:hypothetical protein
MEASKSYSHNTLRSSQHTVRTREQSHHIAQCLCSRDLGGWLAGWLARKNSLLRFAQKQALLYFKYLELLSAQTARLFDTE